MQGKELLNDKNPVVLIDVDGFGEIEVELFPNIAPITVKNFLSLVDKKFYDGIIFHRIISGFMIQGGDPKGIGIGGSGVNIKGEFKANGVKNDLLHTKGVISMARTNVKDSASSQFFICTASAPHLDGDYAAFGKVIKGIETVDYLNDAHTVNVGGGLTDFPYPVIRIKKVERI